MRTTLAHHFGREETVKLSGTVENFDVFKAIPEARKRKIRFLTGHLNYGIDAHMPVSCQYITMLRDPIDRVISSYYHVLETEHHPWHEEVVSKYTDIVEFVESGRYLVLDNGQTRMLYGNTIAYGFGKCPKSVLETAKSNIDRHFLFAGLTERFKESVAVLQGLLGIELKQDMGRKNVTKNRPRKQDLPKKTLRMLKQCNRYDITLYAHARKRFERTLRAVEKGGVPGDSSRR